MNARTARRDGYAVLRELRLREYTFTKVARDIQITCRLVCETAHGRANNKKTLRRMLEIGVPADILYLPPDLQADLQAAASRESAA